MEFRILALFLILLISGCISIPHNYNWDEWEDYSIKMSETTLHFEAPVGRSPFTVPRFESNVDIYNDSPYNPNNDKLVVFAMAAEWAPKKNIHGYMTYAAYVTRQPMIKENDIRTVKSVIEDRDYTGHQDRLANKMPVGAYDPMRFKYSYRFPNDESKWLVYDYSNRPIQPDMHEIFCYPIDETHFLTIYFYFMDDTRPNPDDPKRYLLWYKQAEAMADRILESIRIERTTPIPDIGYGVEDIGVIHPSQIPYVDMFTERPLLTDIAKE